MKDKSKWKSKKAKSIEAAIEFVKKDLDNHYWALRDNVPYIFWRKRVKHP